MWLFLPADILKSSLLSWEEKFCILAGVSWEKVVAAKKYIYCYDNVFKWNDTAGKDALFNAKERFWAMINGLPCDAPVPDPDMYIDKIDWNSKINPGLISDLDKEYFNPDEADNSAPDPTAGRNEKNIGNGENPWESYCVQNTKDLKDVAQDWNSWGLKSKIVENPWEQRYVNDNGALKDNKWENSGVNSWGCNQGLNNIRQSNNLSISCGWNNWDTSFNKSRDVYNNVNSWNTQPEEALKDRRWRDCGDNSRDSKRWANQKYEHENFDSRRSSRGGRAFSGDCLEREGSQQHAWRHKSRKLEGHESGGRQLWS